MYYNQNSSPESEDETDQDDPRKDEDWKLQKRKGCLKDREEKEKTKTAKLSKTKKINSNEPLVTREKVADKIKKITEEKAAASSCVDVDVDMFDINLPIQFVYKPPILK